jgi:hypothetical protein
MKTKILVAFGLAFLAFCTTGRADITNAWWHDDGDGVLVCKTWGNNSGSLPAPNMTMTGDQYTVPGQSAAGHMLGWVQTDSPTDPTLYLGSAVDNDTAFAWTSYQVNVVMPVDFSFVANSEYVANYPASPPNGWTPDWTVANVIAPILQNTGIYANKYEGTINLTGGTPVQVGDELDFGYGIHFAGSTDYSFTQEMIPMGVVPEPSDLGLASALLFGGIELVKRLRRKS